MLFLFDSGAGASLIRGETAEGLDFEGEATVSVTGGAGTETVRRLQNTVVELAGVSADVSLGAGLDALFSGLSDHVGTRVDGIVGSDIIGRFVVEMDLGAGALTFNQPEEFKAPAGGDTVALEFTRGKPAVGVELTTAGGATVAGLIVVDTGSDGQFSLNAPFVQKHNLLHDVTEARSSSNTGVGGDSPEVEVAFASALVGATRFPAPTISLSTGDKGNAVTTAYDGTMGAAALSGYRVIFDYGNSRMIFLPPSVAPAVAPPR
jgi:hypothetical protein